MHMQGCWHFGIWLLFAFLPPSCHTSYIKCFQSLLSEFQGRREAAGRQTHGGGLLLPVCTLQLAFSPTHTLPAFSEGRKDKGILFLPALHASLFSKKNFLLLLLPLGRNLSSQTWAVLWRKTPQGYVALLPTSLELCENRQKPSELHSLIYLLFLPKLLPSQVRILSDLSPLPTSRNGQWIVDLWHGWSEAGAGWVGWREKGEGGRVGWGSLLPCLFGWMNFTLAHPYLPQRCVTCLSPPWNFGKNPSLRSGFSFNPSFGWKRRTGSDMPCSMGWWAGEAGGTGNMTQSHIFTQGCGDIFIMEGRRDGSLLVHLAWPPMNFFLCICLLEAGAHLKKD